MTEKITITGGNESCYLDAATRSKLWKMAERLGVKRNEIVKKAIAEYLEKREGKK